MLSKRVRSLFHPTIKRTYFISTEVTPNPNSMKFLPGREVLNEKFGTGMFFQRDETKEISKSPLAKELFEHAKGVKSVFFGRDFVTITKATNYSWHTTKQLIFIAMFEFFAQDRPVVLEETQGMTDTTILDTDDEIVATIKELIETRIRPSVQEDGGDIFYAGFDSIKGIVQVRLAGSCVGCPSSAVTLRNGVENMLTHYIPEVKGIEDVTGA